MTFFDTATGIVDAANVAVVAPAGTVTDGGIEATCGSPLASVTWAPPLGAAAPSVSVHVAWVPPTTVVGFTTNFARAGLAACALAGTHPSVEQATANAAPIAPLDKRRPGTDLIMKGPPTFAYLLCDATTVDYNPPSPAQVTLAERRLVTRCGAGCGATQRHPVSTTPRLG